MMENGDIEWNPSDIVSWIRERDPRAVQELDQSTTTGGDSASHRTGGRLARSITQQVAEIARSGTPIIERVNQGTYRVIHQEIQNIIARQEHRVEASNAPNTPNQVSSETTEQTIQATIPSPLVVLPSEILDHISANVSEESNENSTSESSPQPEFGYLYLAYNERSFPGWVKAGYSSETNRINNYQTGDPHRAYRSIAYAAIHASASMTLLYLEAQFHTLLLPHKSERGRPSQTKNSEWFRISHTLAIQVLRDLHPESFLMAPDYVATEEE
jgi:hypothetical protein